MTEEIHNQIDEILSRNREPVEGAVKEETQRFSRLGQQHAQQIVSEAWQEAEEIIATSQKKAEGIIEDSQRQAGDIIWDVVNEAVHCRVWGDWNKDSYIQNKFPEPLERIVPYVRDALTWAHQANPDAKLLINDYRVIVEGNFRRRYKQLIDTLISDKTPLSAIGIQAHEPFKGKYWYSPEELWRTYELFGSQTGRPIYITEFFYVSDESQQIRGNYRRGNWSPDSQADAVEDFYRVSFGHPSVEAIIYFGLSDSDVVQPKCGLLDEQYNPKPAWYRLKKLIWEEWTTEATGRTSHDGTFRFRGFFGRYKVTARLGNAVRKFNIHLEKNKPNRWIFTLNLTEN